MKHYLLVILLFSLLGQAYSSEISPIEFSELTVDAPPGDNGSWVELYNTSDKKEELDGYTIVCNNKKVFTFPATNLIIQPRGIILIKFNKKERGYSFLEHVFFASPNALQVKTNPDIIGKEGAIAKKDKYIKQRSPGYCALFKSSEINSNNLVDYVLWGREEFLNKYPNEISKTQNNWAQKHKIWQSFEGIKIGIDPPIAGLCYFNENIILKRKLLSKTIERQKYWSVEYLRNATPGTGNLWSSNLFPFLAGDIYNVGEKLRISAFRFYKDKRIFLMLKGKKIMIKLQIAKDPHFEEIIYNKLVPPKTTIEDYDFKAGTYFARVRIDMDEVSTDWSPVSSFRYKKKNDKD